MYLAHDLALDRPVAIKFIAPEKAGDEASRRRLVREARAAAALDHPNICGVHEVIVEPDGRAAIVMQYVEGQTLAERLRDGPLDVRLALSIAANLAAALSVAHRRGIVHRDVKPQNVIITPEQQAKLLDFGVATQTPLAPESAANDTTTVSLTTQGAVIGTPAYMSPEQAQRAPLDGRSDLFSLGTVLYECLTGRRPFGGRTAFETVDQILHHEPPPVSSLRPELSLQHDELCRRLLAKHPDDRLRSADELLGALRLLTPDTGRSPAPYTTDLRSGTSLRRRAGLLQLAGLRPFEPRRASVAVFVLLVVAVVVGLAASDRLWRRAPLPSGATAIGVLPFKNDSGDPDNDLLAAGLPDALAKRLAAVASLRVLPSGEIRDAIQERPDPAAVSRSLGAAFVVEGTVSKAGDETEVTASLVAPDGRRQAAGRYLAAGSPLDLQRRLAAGVLAVLMDEGVVSGSTAPDTPPPTENAEAFAEYLQARVFVERPDVPGNIDHAIRLFQSATAKDPRFALAHAGLAEAYWAQFQETKDPRWTSQALAANLEALRIDPAQAEVRLSLAVMYHGQGRRDEAVEEVKRVLALQPQNDNAHRLLADIHIAHSEWDAAIAAAKDAVTHRPSYWRNHSQLGLAYFRAGRYDEAADAYQRVVELQPDSARGYQTLGTALQAAGRNDEALEKYEKAISIRPTARTYSNVATLYFWRGEYQKAADVYEKAVTLAPNDPELHANLGDAYARLGQSARAAQSYGRAVEQVQPLLDVSPNDSQLLASYALYRAKLRQRSAAQDAIQRAVAISPADGQVLYAAALVYALSGDTGRACGALTSALASGASGEEVRHAVELRTLRGCAAYDRLAGSVR